MTLHPPELQHVIDSGYAVPAGIRPDDWAGDLLDLLGHPDPRVRDEQAYRILTHWIRAGQYDATLPQLAVRAVALLGPHPASGLPDNVQARSFAALILGELVRREAQTLKASPVLNHVLAEQRTRVRRLAFSVGLNWFANEADVRSYDPTLGWLHAVAHGADLARELALHPQTDRLGLRLILDAIIRRFQTLPLGLHQTEDDRLAYALLAVLSRPEYTPADLRQWFKAYAEVCNLQTFPQAPGAALALRVLHSLHTFLHLGGVTIDGVPLRPAHPQETLEAVRDTLRSLYPV